jgi:hypothetical protein
MDATNERILRLTWNGQEYECLPNMQCLMMIEERVLLHKLGTRIIQGADHIPPTHLHWVVYCLLHCAGARLTADDVHGAAASGDLDSDALIKVARWIVAEVFGVGPEQEEAEEEAGGEGKDAA